MARVVDLNCDMGESFGAYLIGNDEEAIGYITSANIACGFHASDPVVMEKTVKLCRDHKVGVGAHPGYPDLVGFGRRHMDIDAVEVVSSVIYQVGALKGFADYFGVPLQHVKLHGALYNNMAVQEETLLRILAAVRKAFGDVIFLTLGTRTSAALKKRLKTEGVRLGLEAFPDRAYSDDGGLLPRRFKEAVLKDPEQIARRAVKMVREGGVESAGGQWITMDIDTLCIHGDNRESILAAAKIREYMAEEGIVVQRLSGFLL
jgi:UPF0271 protein